MTQMVENSSLRKMEKLRTLIDASFPSELINGEKCYKNNQGQYFIPRYVTDDGEVDCLFFEYADNITDAKMDMFYDGGWIYIPDYPNGEALYNVAVKQINS